MDFNQFLHFNYPKPKFWAAKISLSSRYSLRKNSKSKKKFEIYYMWGLYG